MPRMRILSTTEQEQFEKPPVFDKLPAKKIIQFERPLGSLLLALPRGCCKDVSQHNRVHLW